MGLERPPELGTPMLPPDTFRGRAVYVTGGGTGLGKAIAVEFARAGADVAIASRDAGHRAAGAAAIEAVGARAFATEVDVRKPESIAQSFDDVEAALGPISILINNAAGNFAAPAERLSPNAWNAVIGIVLNGTFFCSTEFARRRIALKAGGAILNIGATYAWTGGPVASHSAAAKAATANLTQTLAVEWAPDNIRVNGLAPGLFPATDRSVHALGMGRGAPSRGGSSIPAQRVGEAHELGWAATYLCSPFAAYLTGHTLVLDGANWLRRYGFGMPEFEPVRERFDRERAEAAADQAAGS
jgi:NAD(P)-dependent dehydrogenase (short-subunit alcohol dehydrogenase family)